jgi:hypothetical protein
LSVPTRAARRHGRRRRPGPAATCGQACVVRLGTIGLHAHVSEELTAADHCAVTTQPPSLQTPDLSCGPRDLEPPFCKQLLVPTLTCAVTDELWIFRHVFDMMPVGFACASHRERPGRRVAFQSCRGTTNPKATIRSPMTTLSVYRAAACRYLE